MCAVVRNTWVMSRPSFVASLLQTAGVYVCMDSGTISWLYMCMYVCMYMYIYIYIYIYTDIYIYVCMYVYVYVCISSSCGF